MPGEVLSMIGICINSNTHHSALILYGPARYLDKGAQCSTEDASMSTKFQGTDRADFASYRGLRGFKLVD